MRETDYLKATNLAKISSALTILSDVLASNDNDWGITSNELTAITRPLRQAQEKLFSLVEIEESQDVNG